MIPTYQRGQIGLFRRPVAGGGGGGYQTETNTWETRIGVLGGSVTTQEKDWADAFVVAMKAASYYASIRLVYPFIGASIAAHRVPLIDKPNVGAAALGGSSVFTDSDCDTSTGIVNSTEKNAWLDTLITPFGVNSADVMGMGFYERNWGAGSNVEPTGCYNSSNTERFVLDLRSNMQRFRFGDPTGSQVGPGTTASSAHYYGQRSSSTLRKIYKDGSLLDTATAGAGTSGSNSQSIYIMGCHLSSGSTPWKGRCACAYFTDGLMADADASAFHTLLGTYLITPTGR